MIARIPLSILSTVTTGFAIFSMFFGSGNLIFPVELGQRAGHNVVYGYAGLFITGVFFTLLSLIALILYRGNCHTFFNRLGKMPGTTLNVCVLIMIGPLTGLPRAINVLHQIGSNYMGTISLFNFIIFFLTGIFFACYKRERIMPLLGYVISPLLVFLLLALIIKSWLHGAPLCYSDHSSFSSFYRGIYEGYATMDMMAAFHFAPLAITYLQRMSHLPHLGPKRVLWSAIGASAITCTLLAIIYSGLAYMGAQYCTIVNTNNPVTIAYTITNALLPEEMVAGLHILFMLAIISTAISLATIFTDFLYEDIFDKRISYGQALIVTLILSGCSANGGLHAILRFEKPFLALFYPPLLVLTLCNIAYKAFRFRPVKGPVFAAFCASIVSYIIK